MNRSPHGITAWENHGIAIMAVLCTDIGVKDPNVYSLSII